MRVVFVMVVVAALTACLVRGEESARFVESGVALEVPPGWSVTGFSKTVSPRRLVAASYRVAPDDVEGDCGGLAAVQRLPADGAYVVLIDYGAGSGSLAEFTDSLPVAALRDGQLAEFECFGHSYAFYFRSGGRALQAHVGIGGSADSRRKSDALALLNSLEVEAG